MRTFLEINKIKLYVCIWVYFVQLDMLSTQQTVLINYDSSNISHEILMRNKFCWNIFSTRVDLWSYAYLAGGTVYTNLRHC